RSGLGLFRIVGLGLGNQEQENEWKENLSCHHWLPDRRRLRLSRAMVLSADPKRGRAPSCVAPCGPFRQRCPTPFRIGTKPHAARQVTSASRTSAALVTRRRWS